MHGHGRNPDEKLTAAGLESNLKIRQQFLTFTIVSAENPAMRGFWHRWLAIAPRSLIRHMPVQFHPEVHFAGPRIPDRATYASNMPAVAEVDG